MAMTPSVLQHLDTVSRIGHWQSATWQDYVDTRDRLNPEQFRLFFHQGYLLIEDMGWEGIDHAAICDLLTMIFGFWFGLHSEQTATSLGRCLLEKDPNQSGAPDLVIYLGDEFPQWQPGESRRVELRRWRSPDLVGEISDTTLATDLDEKKQLYASMNIAEYWVVDVRGQRLFVFQLQATGKYQLCDHSQVLAGVPVPLIEQTILRLKDGSNISAAAWFNQQVSQI